MTYQAPTTGLHSPTLLPFLWNFNDYLMLAQSWKFGVKCCIIGLAHPAACTQAHVPLNLGRVHRPPFYPGNQLSLSRCYILIFVEVAQEKTGNPPPQLKSLRGTNPTSLPPRFYPNVYQSIALDVKNPHI